MAATDPELDLLDMPTFTLHYNASCPDWVRQASPTARLDWLGASLFNWNTP